jgi:hypothetical protein
VTVDATIVATFGARPALLTIRKTEAGSVVSQPIGINCGRKCRSTFVAGRVTLTARPVVGWRFAHWQGICHSARPVCSVTLGRGAVAGATATFSRK